MACDSVYLTHPNNNPINIIQRISRANRLDKNNANKIARIFVWAKDQIKKDQIFENLTKTITIKYGGEHNDFVNRQRVEEKADAVVVNGENSSGSAKNKCNECKSCGKKFINKERLEYHIQKMLCTKKFYGCKLCDARFTSANAMYRHMKHVCKMKKQMKEQKNDIHERVLQLEEENNKNKQEYEKQRQEYEKKLENMKKEIKFMNS